MVCMTPPQNHKRTFEGSAVIVKHVAMAGRFLRTLTRPPQLALHLPHLGSLFKTTTNADDKIVHGSLKKSIDQPAIGCKKGLPLSCKLPKPTMRHGLISNMLRTELMISIDDNNCHPVRSMGTSRGHGHKAINRLGVKVQTGRLVKVIESHSQGIIRSEWSVCRL